MSGYGWYGLKPCEYVRLTKKENGKKLSKIVKVVKEYSYFVLVEVTGKIGNYQTSINKSLIYTQEVKLEKV